VQGNAARPHYSVQSTTLSSEVASDPDKYLQLSG
jgi:hypothetical protein